MARRRVLTLATERKLSDLIEPPKGSAVLEASGVIAKDGYYYVVFDNIRRLARVQASLTPGSKAHAWFGGPRDGEGYEDLAFSPHTRRFYLLIEAEKHPDGTYKALIDECDEEANYKRRRWVDFKFDRRNTGFEGLCAVRWKDGNYLLALCEGNRGKGGRKGKKPGGGLIQVLKRSGTVWKPVASIELPSSVKFEDYSAVSIRGRQIAVISQQTSRLWVGTIKFGDWTIADAGTLYDFPRTRKGKIKYCTLEGLCWLSARSFVVVSDLARDDYPKRCRKRDQSIHVFRIPTRGSGLLSHRG
ncbi:MAG TPA: hypothetical protein VMZ90_11715 [Vicinamibacterales bacterium]|nr:hypothetical protein [Vicinamibacterales bacterium]